MKKIIVFLVINLIIIFNNIDLKSRQLNINDTKIDLIYMMDFAFLNKDLYIIGPPSFENEKGFKIVKLTNDITTEVILESEVINKNYIFKSNYKIKSDDKGNLYFLGNKILKYDGTNVTEILIESTDSLTKYNNIVVAKDGSIWFLVTETFPNMEERYKYKTSIVRIKNNITEIVYTRQNSTAFAYSFLQPLNDGKVLALRAFNKLNDLDTIEFDFDKINHDMYYWDENLNLTTESLPTSSGYDYLAHNKEITYFNQKLNGDLEIGFDFKGYKKLNAKYWKCCGGYVEKRDNKWVIYDTTRGLPFHDNGYITVYGAVNYNGLKYLFSNNTTTYAINEIGVKDSYNSNKLLINENLYLRELDIMTERFNTEMDFLEVKVLELDNKLYICSQQSIMVIDKANLGLVSSIEDNEDQNQINVYPNPVTDLLNVNIDLSNGEKTNYKIFDLNSKIVNSNELLNNQIDVSNLIKGVYILEINNSNNTNKIKFIKE